MTEMILTLMGFIPEMYIVACKNCEQHNPYHIYNVWEHIVAVANNVPQRKIMVMVALLHDIGKPQCKTTDENGIDHFYGHAKKSAEIARNILCDIGDFTEEEKETILFLVENHDSDIGAFSRKTTEKKVRKYGFDKLFMLAEIRRADILGQATEFNYRLKGVEAFVSVLKEIEKASKEGETKLAITGGDLIAAGVKAGPQLGRILSALKTKVENEEISNDKEMLIQKGVKIYEMAS